MTIGEIKKYGYLNRYMVNFNNILLDKIESIIEEGKRLGEISNTVVPKSIAINTLSLLQGSIVLWIMNQNIDIRVLFEISFKHLWNSIKEPENDMEF